MKEKKLSVNVALNVFKTVLNLCFPLITFPYVSRVIQTENYGKINFVSSIISYFLLIASLGISAYAIREGSKIRNNKDEFKKFSSEIFTINIIFTFFSYMLLLITYLFWYKLHQYMSLVLIQSLIIFFTTLGVEWIYSIYEDFLYITIRSIIFQVLSIILLFVLVKSPDDYLIYAGITVLSSVGSNIFNFINSRKYCKICLTKSINFKKHLMPILILFFSNITITIYANSDITILNIFKGDYIVGIYSVSVKIYTIIKQLISAIFIVIIPRLSFYIANDKEKYKLLLLNLKKGILIFSFPITIGAFLLSREIILLLSGSEYILSVSPLMILVFALPFSALATMYGNGVLLLKNKEKCILISTIVGATMNIILNIVLIPHFSYNAAAFTTLLSEFIVFILNYIFSKKCIRGFDLKIELGLLIRTIIGTLFIIIICGCFKKIISNNFLIIASSVFCSIIVYMFILLINNKKLMFEIMEVKNDKKYNKNL